MTRQEFLKLSTGMQIWALIAALRFVLVALLPRHMSGTRVREALRYFDGHIDTAGREADE